MTQTPPIPAPSLTLRKLWRLFSGKHFAKLSSEHIAHIADMASSPPTHTHELPTLSATAACLLWYLGPASQHDAALHVLTSQPLPGHIPWQRQLARRLPHDALVELVRILIGAQFYGVAASLASSAIAVHVRTRTTNPRLARLRACDLVSQSAPQRFRDLLELMCDATLLGELDFAWLEWPMRACIRMNIDSPARQEQLRRFYTSEPFDASLERVASLYTPIIHAEYLAHDSQVPRHLLLFQHAEKLLETHPRRAQHLLELAIIFMQRTGAVTLKGKLRRALARYSDPQAFAHEPILARLARLYVSHYAIEPARVAFVEQVITHTSYLDDVPEDILNTYLIVGDYDRAFEHLTCSYEGLSIQHIDKEAATRVTYYVERHPTPKINAQIFDLAMAPVGWVQRTLREVHVPRQLFNQLLPRYVSSLRSVSQHTHALAALHQTHELAAFEDIFELPIGPIERALKPSRTRHMAIAAASGAVAALAAFVGNGSLATLDAPIMLMLVQRICHNLCWLYGFDPGEHPDLVNEIIHVALWGPRPNKSQSAPELERALEDLAMRKSLITGAITRGSMTRSSLYMIQSWIENQTPSPSIQRALDLSRGVLNRAPNRATTHTPTLFSRSLPALGAIMGALLNATFVYDLFEAAQAVLTDRFLARKYPGWPAHFAVIQDEEE